MKLFVLFTLVAAVAAHNSVCIPKPVSNVEPLAPPSVTVITAAASKSDEDLSSDINIIEGIILSSPSFRLVESDIEEYARSHYDTISELEQYDESPLDITSATYFNSLVSEFPVLASAVNLLVSEEAAHSSLYGIQDSLQTVMVDYPTIITACDTSFEFSHASLISAESSVSKAGIFSPSVVTDAEVATLMIMSSPSLSSAFCEITEAAADYPSVLQEITSARDWSDTDAWKIDTVLKSVETCYPTLYTAINEVDSFLETHSSDVSRFSNLISVLSSQPTIITDVESIVSSLSPSLQTALNDVSIIENTESHITTDFTYLDLLEADSPSLVCAEGTLSRVMDSDASVISAIEDAISSPSAINDEATVCNEELEYPSIVSAIREITCVESSHPSFYQVQSSIESAELVSSDILTEAEEVVSATSPSLAADVSDMDVAISICSSISSALNLISVIEEASPSLSCDESIIAQYASSKPSILYTIINAIDSPSDVAPSTLKYITELTARYSSLVSALHSISSIESKFPSLSTAQTEIDFVVTYEPDVLSVYKQLTEYESIVTNEVCSFASSYSYHFSYHKSG